MYGWMDGWMDGWRIERWISYQVWLMDGICMWTEIWWLVWNEWLNWWWWWLVAIGIGFWIWILKLILCVCVVFLSNSWDVHPRLSFIIPGSCMCVCDNIIQSYPSHTIAFISLYLYSIHTILSIAFISLYLIALLPYLSNCIQDQISRFMAGRRDHRFDLRKRESVCVFLWERVCVIFVWFVF